MLSPNLLLLHLYELYEKGMVKKSDLDLSRSLGIFGHPSASFHDRQEEGIGEIFGEGIRKAKKHFVVFRIIRLRD
jgi:hypothetical protein